VCYFENSVLLGYDACLFQSSVPDVSQEPNALTFNGLSVLDLETLKGGPTLCCVSSLSIHINPLKPNDHYRGRTAPLTSKHCILYTDSTNIGTEYFKHGIYSPFFSSSKCRLFHNSNIFGSCIIHILYTGCAKFKKNNSGAKRLIAVLTKRGVGLLKVIINHCEIVIEP